MESIWVGLWPSARATKVLAMRGPSETILKAHLSLRPSSARAITTLFEAIALWEGAKVRAALVADGASTSSSPTSLYRDAFAIFGEETPLYGLEWIPRAPVRHRRNGLDGMGSFAELERLLVQTVAR